MTKYEKFIGEKTGGLLIIGITKRKWEELRELCGLKFKSYSSYFKKAKKLGVPTNQFFAEQNYKSII